MDESDHHLLTSLLNRLNQGDREAEQAFSEEVYRQLRNIARNLLRNERAGHTLQPTALVNEYMIHLFGGSQRASWEDRNHFYRVAAKKMRLLLVDHARVRVASKRGGPRGKRSPGGLSRNPVG